MIPSLGNEFLPRVRLHDNSPPENIIYRPRGHVGSGLYAISGAECEFSGILMFRAGARPGSRSENISLLPSEMV